MTSIELAKRQEKALPLKVFQVSDDQFYVENSDGKVCYKVSLNGNGNSCTCTDFATNGKNDPAFMCKHLLAAVNSKGIHQRIGGDAGGRSLEPRQGLGVYQAISAVQMSLAKGGIAKLQQNIFDKYNFRGIDDVYNSLGPILAEHKLCILPRMLSRTCEERQSQKGGSLFYVTVNAEFDFVAASDGSRHAVKMYGEAMDRSDKATNKAMSAAYKYACFQTFCIPIEGAEADSDADFTSPEVKRKSESTARESKPKAEPKPDPPKEKESKTKAKPRVKEEPKPTATVNEPETSETNHTMSLAQQKAIQNLAKRRGIPDEDLEKMSQDQYGVCLKDLPSKDASAFIRQLQKSA